MICSWLIDEKDEYVKSIDEICKLYNIKDKYSLYGFTYVLKLRDSQDNICQYIGKKNFYFVRMLPTKKDKLPRAGHVQFIRKRKNHKLKEYEIIKKESDWLTYTGSFKRQEEYTVLCKTILDICQSQRMLTYLEAKELFSRNAIMDEKYINDNILGKFFRGNLREPDPVIDYSNPDLATNGGVYLPICS